MKFMTIPMTAIAVLTAAGASAQGVEYLSYGADYTNLSADGESIDLYSFDASVDYRINEAFVSGSLSVLDASGDGASLSVTGISARAGYFVVPQAVVYGGLNYLDTSETSSFSTYNIGAEYTFDAFTVGVNYDDSSEDGYLETTSLYGSYRVNSDLEVALGFSDTDGTVTSLVGFEYDTGTYDINAVFSESDGITVFGIDGIYDFGNNFRAIGNFVDIDGEANIFAVGAGYEVAENTWLDLELGQIDVDGGTADVIGLSINYDLGNETLLIDRAATTQVEALGVLGEIADFGL